MFVPQRGVDLLRQKTDRHCVRLRSNPTALFIWPEGYYESSRALTIGSSVSLSAVVGPAFTH